MLWEGWTVSPCGCGGSIHRLTCRVLLQPWNVVIAICMEEMRRDGRRDIVEGVKDKTVMQRGSSYSGTDSMKSSTALGSNLWDRGKGRGGRWSG